MNLIQQCSTLELGASLCKPHLPHTSLLTAPIWDLFIQDKRHCHEGSAHAHLSNSAWSVEAQWKERTNCWKPYTHVSALTYKCHKQTHHERCISKYFTHSSCPFLYLSDIISLTTKTCPPFFPAFSRQGFFATFKDHVKTSKTWEGFLSRKEPESTAEDKEAGLGQ